MVSSGTSTNMGVAMAPTTYDSTPWQYMMRCSQDSLSWNSGQCSLENMTWK